MSFHETPNYRNESSMEGVERSAAPTTSLPNHNYPANQHNHYQQQSASPAPIHHPHQYTQQASNTYTQPLDHYSPAAAKYPQPQAGTYPRPSEVFRLPENANLLIPEEIRDQFQQDEHGHVLFFAAPPMDVLPPAKPGSLVGHSAKYLAAKLRDKLAAADKRKAVTLLPPNGVNGDDTLGHHVSKKPKQDHSEGADHDDDNDDSDEVTLERKIADTKRDAMQLWIQQMRNSTDRIYQDLYGEHWEEGKKLEAAKLAAAQQQQQARSAQLETSRVQRAEREKVDLVVNGIFKDDYDQRY